MPIGTPLLFVLQIVGCTLDNHCPMCANQQSSKKDLCVASKTLRDMQLLHSNDWERVLLDPLWPCNESAIVVVVVVVVAAEGAVSLSSLFCL